MLGSIDSSNPTEMAPYFPQGMDIEVFFYLTVDGVALDPTIYDIEIIVKKNEYSEDVIWYGKYSNETELVKVSPELNGYFKVRIPASVTADFLSGMYYMDVKATEADTTEGAPKQFIVATYTFGVKLSAASPNPGLTISDAQELIFDGVNPPIEKTSLLGSVPKTPNSMILGG